MKYGFPLIVSWLIFALPCEAKITTEFFTVNDSIVYVWDFTVSDSSIKKIGNQLTNDFETELINSGLYTVLERRNYHRVLAHQNLQNEISDVENLPSASVDSLKAIKAGVVIFGEVRDDIMSGEYEITVTFQSLNEIILRKGSILMKRGLINDNQTRKNAMKELLDRLHKKELMATKKEQFEVVSMVLSTYMVRVKDVQKEFRDISGFAFNDKNYFEALGQKIMAYNEVFDDLHNNRAKYHMDFAKSWKEARAQDLDAIFKGILDDIHKTHILKLDRVRVKIGNYGLSELKNTEKRKMRQEIIDDVNEITDDLKTQIDIMDLRISSFQSQIRSEMSD